MAVKNRQHTILINGESYYTAQKAQEVIAMSYSGLRYQVLIGNIKSEIPKGRRQSYYNAKDVDQVAIDLQAFSIQRSKIHTKFTAAKRRSEIESIIEISQVNVFRVEEDVVDERMEILAKNPETYYILKDEKQILGYTAIWPLKPGKLNSVLAQTLPVKVSPEDVEVFEEEKHIDLYINAMHVK
jgi:hypothetical protein